MPIKIEVKVEVMKAEKLTIWVIQVQNLILEVLLANLVTSDSVRIKVSCTIL